MNFTIDDIDILALNGSNRLDATGEYDISYYENYIKEDIRIIDELITYIRDRIDRVKDENMKSFLMRSLNIGLGKVYENMRQKKAREESENSKYKLDAGYYGSHPNAYYIEKDFPIYIKNNYTKIIKFMNDLYIMCKYTEEKGMFDQNALYDIFRQTKNACKKLGIHCINAEQLYDTIVENNEDLMSILEVGIEINDEEPMSNDIEITSLPYSITLPTFSHAGIGETYQYPVSEPKSIVWYNRSYIDSLNRKSETLNSMVEESTKNSLPRMRNPQESDEDYYNYLKEFYGEGTQHK